jgi:hypothetical protein
VAVYYGYSRRAGRRPEEGHGQAVRLWEIDMIWFKKNLRWKCLDFIRNQTFTMYSSEQSIQKMLNEAKMLEDYIVFGKIPQWSKL